MLTVFDSAVIDRPDRLAAWEAATATSLIPTAIDSPEPDRFTARLAALSLGDAQVTSMTYTSLSSRRSPRLIRASDPEFYQVALTRSGRQGLMQYDRSVVLGRNELVLYDSSRPFEATAQPGGGPVRSVILQFPKSLLPLPPHQVAALCAIALPGNEGIGRLLAAFFASLADGDTRWTDRDARRLQDVAVDLTTAVLAHHLERENPPLRSPTHALYLQAIAFIEDNLHRADLHPATIAAAHRISPRYLHRIFQQHHPSSVAAHVRLRRLDRARRDLADRRLDHLTVAAIARRWGFARPGDFSRAFRRHTGASPRDYRNDS